MGVPTKKLQSTVENLSNKLETKPFDVDKYFLTLLILKRNRVATANIKEREKTSSQCASKMKMTFLNAFWGVVWLGQAGSGGWIGGCRGVWL